MQYILLIQNNAVTEIAPEEWGAFIAEACATGWFQGGSEIGRREILGNRATSGPTEHITGYMRFDGAEREKLLELLENHPVIRHGGSGVLCELPKS